MPRMVNRANDVTPESGSFDARELRVAESLQRVLLRTPSPESLPGICVKTFYEAALDESTVGGDSVDAFVLPGNRVALVVADASGKGLAAAERVAVTRFEAGDALLLVTDGLTEARRRKNAAADFHDSQTIFPFSLLGLGGVARLAASAKAAMAETHAGT